MTKAKIEKEISQWGDYVQIDNLTRFLKTAGDIPYETRKFVNQKLGEIYGKRGMFFDSAASYEKTADLCLSKTEKTENFLKAIENYIKACRFGEVDQTAKKIFQDTTESERKKIIDLIKNFYRKEAERNLKEKRKGNTLKIYEKMLDMNSVSAVEKMEIKEKLLRMYLDLGMVLNYNRLKNRNFAGEKPKKSSEDEEIEGLEFLYR